MEATNLSPTPPDRFLLIALALVAILGSAEVIGVAVHYLGRARPHTEAAIAKMPEAPASLSERGKETSAPAEAVSAPATPSAEVLSVAERLLKEATLLREKGDTNNALTRLQDAAQRDPANANVLSEMAMIYESLQLFDRSKETWRKVQKIGPSAGPLFELAEMKLKTDALTPTTSEAGSDLAGNPPPETSTVRSDEGIPENATLGITEVTATDTPDAESETHLTLKISVKARPNTVVDHTKVKIQVFFYDIVDNKDIVLTDADVSYEWLTPDHDWKTTNPEMLSVTYTRLRHSAVSPDTALAVAAAAITPPGKKKNSGKTESTADPQTPAGTRKYLGYIIRIYYSDQLQASRAEPSRLLDQFPPPVTLSSQ